MICRNSAHYFLSFSGTHQLLVAKFDHQLSALIASALMINLCTHQASVCVRGTTVICSNTHTNAANRAQTDEVPGTRKAKKEKKQIPMGKQWKVGKGREGRGTT